MIIFLGQNVNMKGGRCTTHLAPKPEDFASSLPASLFITEPKERHVLDNVIRTLSHKTLSGVTNFQLAQDFLRHNGQKFSPDHYCIDYVLDYCQGAHVEPVLSAIIDDKTLHGQKPFTIYGNGGSDGFTMTTLKQVGYGISLFFLFLTLAIHLVLPELKRVSK